MISLIIPVYNAEKNLTKCLDSVLAQSYPDFEVILINDGSTDRSHQIIEHYKTKDSRFRIFTQENSGPSAARNVGIENAKGKYLAFADSDDWLHPDYLKELLKNLERENADLACAGYYEMNPPFPSGLKLHDFNEQSLKEKVISVEHFQSNLFEGVTGVLWAKLFKKEIFDRNTIRLNPNLRLSEDLLTVLAYSTHIKTVVLIPEALYYYNRLDEEGLSGKAKISNFADLDLFGKEVMKFQSKVPFLNLENIINNRKILFSIKFLKAHTSNFKEFSESAVFVRNNTYLIANNTKLSRLDQMIWKWIGNRKEYKAWIILKAYQFLRNLKNG